jgi:pantoate--beta-alanine ligase
MKIIDNIQEIKTLSSIYKDKTIGFVPTMGALHLGHISLIEKAKKQNDIVVVSIFVNPTQFGENEDLDTYPRTQEADIKACQLSNCDYLFIPQVEQIYPFVDDIKIKSPQIKSYILEGSIRDSHFDGVLQVVLKLFNIINPHKAYFGKKDAQQVLLIEQMVNDLFLDIDIVFCDTIREKDGLALSSRNIYLDSDDRQEVLKISQSLAICMQKIQQGQKDTNVLISTIQDSLDGLDIDYIQIVDKNLRVIDKIEFKNTIILIAVNIKNKRYIDNLWL